MLFVALILFSFHLHSIQLQIVCGLSLHYFFLYYFGISYIVFLSSLQMNPNIFWIEHALLFSFNIILKMGMKKKEEDFVRRAAFEGFTFHKMLQNYFPFLNLLIFCYFRYIFCFYSSTLTSKRRFSGGQYIQLCAFLSNAKFTVAQNNVVNRSTIFLRLLFSCVLFISFCCCCYRCGFVSHSIETDASSVKPKIFNKCKLWTFQFTQCQPIKTLLPCKMETLNRIYFSQK